MTDQNSSAKVRQIHSPAEIESFLRFPWQVYAGNPFWVPPILRDARGFLSGKTLFFKHCDYALWVAETDSKIVATLAAFYDRNFVSHWKKKTGFLGYFEALEGQNEAVRELIRQGEVFLKEHGAEESWVPVNGSITNPIGFLMNAFDQPPFFLMPYTPSYYPAYFRKQGYRSTQELIAYTMDLMDGRLRRKVRFLMRRAVESKIRLRPFNHKRFREDSDLFTDLYSTTFKAHWGYGPQSREEVYEILEPMRLALDSDLILFAEAEGKPVGFLLTTPNYNDAIKKLDGNLDFLNGLSFLRMRKKIRCGRMIAMGVLDAWRGQGIAPLLVGGILDAMIRKGYTTCEYSWVLKQNIISSSVADKFDSSAYKRYDIFSKKIS